MTMNWRKLIEKYCQRTPLSMLELYAIKCDEDVKFYEKALEKAKTDKRIVPAKVKEHIQDAKEKKKEYLRLINSRKFLERVC